MAEGILVHQDIIPKKISAFEKIGFVLPTQKGRELYYDTFKFGKNKISGKEASNIYKQVEQERGVMPNSIAIQTIEFHNFFTPEPLEPQHLFKIQWYLDPENPLHVSHLLTDKGSNRRLFDVAQKYMEHDKQYLQSIDLKMVDIEQLVEAYRQQKKLPPIILTPRPRGMRPDGGWYTIDGVHRSLAWAVYFLQTNEVAPQELLIA